MRRPLKPFVTEYKQSNRRSPSPLGEPRPLETERSTAKPADFGSVETEDSYEAALRAADALFSGSSTVSAPQSRPFTSFAESQAASTPTPTPEKNGGRILRVIDEAPSPGLAALEAEHAPKRRGRKPGSKNKPKVALVAGQAEPADRPASSLRAATEMSSPAGQPSPPPAVRVEAIMTASRTTKRGGWGRDRLRPGEDWKRRRLPRVCW